MCSVHTELHKSNSVFAVYVTVDDDCFAHNLMDIQNAW